MRVYLRLRRNIQTIPFNYQELLTGTIHKWIGQDNEFHGESGHYSFSWLQNTKANKNGIDLKKDAYFFISSRNENLLKKIIKSILEDPEMFNGISVIDIQIQNTPEFTSSENFLMASPVLLKEKQDDEIRHITLIDDDFEEALTNNLKRKLDKVGIGSEGVIVNLDPETSYRQTKLVSYKGIKNKTSLAPITIMGTPEQIAFAWTNGLGNSTGIGFGALK